MRKGFLRACVAASVMVAAVAGAPAATASGYSWKTVPWGGGGYVDGFVYHPKAPNILYARTDVGGVFRFDFATKRWIPLLDHLSHDERDTNGILSVAVDPNDPGKVFLACGLYLGQWAHNGVVLRSNDQGATWTKTDLPFQVGGNADGRGTGERLQVDPNVGDVLFLGSNLNGLWKSADGAKTFAKLGSFPGSGVTLVLFDPRSGSKGAPTQTLYVGSADSGGGLYVSRDGGASFNPAPGAPAGTPQHAVIGPDGFLYVTFGSGDAKNTNALNPSNISGGAVWKMDLKTNQWHNITPVPPVAGSATFGYSGVDIDPAHPGTIVTSTIDRWWPEPDEIFLSRDGGAHWVPLTSVSKHNKARYPWLGNDTQVSGSEKDRMGSWTSDVKINPFNPDEMIYGTGGGVWMTGNLTAAGSSKPVQFEFADDNLEETAIIQMVSPPAGATVMAAMGDVAGGSWDDITRTPTASGVFAPSVSNWSVDVAWLKPTFLARTSDRKPFGYYSEDGGVHWTGFPSMPPYSPQDAKGNWHNVGPLAVSSGGSSIVWSIPRERAYVSVDKGVTWTPSEGWPAESDATLIPVADRAINGVFYVHDRAGGQILISVDGGKSFKPVMKGIPPVPSYQGSQLLSVPGRMRDLWLATPSGLFHSADPRQPLAALKTVDEAWNVGVGKAAPGKTYPAVYLSGKVKGQTGIWRSDDEGQTWERINDDVHRFGDGGTLTGDPTEYGTVYVARAAGGIVVGKPTQ